jgi:hypothetical protein
LVFSFSIYTVVLNSLLSNAREMMRYPVARPPQNHFSPTAPENYKTQTTNSNHPNHLAIDDGEAESPAEGKAPNLPLPSRERLFKRNGGSNRSNLYQTLLNTRSTKSSVHQWPDWMTIKGSLTKSSCHGWRNETQNQTLVHHRSV